MRRLPKKRKLVGQLVARGEPGSHAVIKAGYQTKYPEKMAWQILQDPRVQAEIQKEEDRIERALERRDVTNDRLAKKLSELLEAKHTNQKGVVEADNRTQLNAVREVNKMKGNYAPEKSQSVHMGIKVDGNDYLDELAQKAREREN